MPEEKPKGIRPGELASLLALAGAFFYTALRVAYGVFYSRLDAKPEDVGLGYQQILAQSAGAVALLAVGIVAAIGLATLFASLLRSQHEVRVSAEPRELAPLPAWRKALGALGLIVVLVVALLFARQESVMAIAFIGLTTAGTLLYQRYRRLDDPRLARRARIGYVSAFMGVGFLIVLVILCVRAADDADAVRDGKDGTFEVLGIPVTSWGAEPGTLAATSTSVSPDALPTGCVLYLGQADGIALVYDPAGSTVRLPVTQVVVSLDHRDDCS